VSLGNFPWAEKSLGRPGRQGNMTLCLNQPASLCAKPPWLVALYDEQVWLNSGVSGEAQASFLVEILTEGLSRGSMKLSRASDKPLPTGSSHASRSSGDHELSSPEESEGGVNTGSHLPPRGDMPGMSGPKSWSCQLSIHLSHGLGRVGTEHGYRQLYAADHAPPQQSCTPMGHSV
jgi:hypothetical protein